MEETLIEGLGYAYGLLQEGTGDKSPRELISDLLQWPRELVSPYQMLQFAQGFEDARQFREDFPEFFKPQNL